MSHAFHALDPNNPKSKGYRRLVKAIKGMGSKAPEGASYAELEALVTELEAVEDAKAKAKE